MFTPLLLAPDFESLSRKRCSFQAAYEPLPLERSNKRRRVVKKSVRFAAFSTQYETTTSPETWYNAQELTSFRDNMKRDILQIAELCAQKKIQELDRNEYSPLGLEKYCCSASAQDHMKFLRTQCIKAVLDQQSIQRQMGLSLPEPLREVSQTFSAPTVSKALSRASKLCRCR